MKLISAFIFALGVYLASVNGDEPAKPVGNAGSETHLSIPAIVNDTSSAGANGKKPVEPAAAPGGEKPLVVVDPPSTSDHSTSTKSPSTFTPPSSSQKPSSQKPTPAPFPTTTNIPVTPQPPPERLSWNVTEGNRTCILLTGKLELEVTETNSTKSIPVTNRTVAEGSCHEKHSYITLFFDPLKTTTLNITFFKNDSAKDYLVHEITGLYSNSTHFKNDTLKLFVTPLDKSYSCTPSADVFISKKKSGNSTVSVSLKVGELKVQAFKTSKGSDFDSGIDCESFPIHTADIVPIVVGCALALLVIAVLAAYLISRRRSQARGYLSM